MGRFRKSLMNEGRRAEIHLLNGRKLDIVIQPRLQVDELLNIVASHCNLKCPDKQYFGLAFIDEFDHYHWLPLDRRVLEFEFPRKYTSNSSKLLLYHSVKFFVESVSALAHPSTVELYFYETKLHLSKAQLELTDVDFYRIGANLLQICAGDYKDDNSVQCLLRQVLPIPRRMLLSYCISSIECEQNIIELYKEMIGTSRGAAMLTFLQIAERSQTYGVRFYRVNDKSGEASIIAINSRGIYQYDVDDRSKPKRIFQWRHLENLYYRDRKFSIEVHDGRRHAQTLSSSSCNDICNSDDFMIDDIDPVDDQQLAAAVCDPTTQVSLSRRAFVPASICIHVFFCDSPFLCKTLWSAAIAQHQFYLDQRTGASKRRLLTDQREGGVNVTELAERLNRLANSTTTTSSIGTDHSDSSPRSLTSSMSGTTVSMSTGKLDDNIISGKIPNTMTFAQRSEFDRKHDLELYRALKTKKSQFEVMLVAKLKELRAICISEGEITGEMPKEIYRSLLPGEPEPKIKRRVGTSFSISDEMIGKQSKMDKVQQMEADIELYRKIVSAAHKLASDKSTNKSVRKKRQKDYTAAHQKLKALEIGLHQLRLSSSKPDVSTLPNRTDKHRAWPNFSGIPAASPLLGRLGGLIAKSCPTTPRGSIPDLTTTTDNEQTDDDDDFAVPLRVGSGRSASSSLQRCNADRPPHQNNNTLSSVSNGLPPPAPGSIRRSTIAAVSGQSPDRSVTSNSNDYDHVPKVSVSSLPIYENIGYRSSSAYQSSYRLTNYPTLHSGTLQHRDSSPSIASSGTVGRVHRTHSEHSLQSISGGSDVAPSQISFDSVLAPPQPLPDYRTAGSDSIEHSVGAYNVPRQRTSWNYRSIEQGLNKKVTSTDDCVDAKATVGANGSPIRSSTTAYQSSPIRHPIPPSVSMTAGICAGSLDRRALKVRQQRSAGNLFQNMPPPSHYTAFIDYPLQSSSSPPGGRPINGNTVGNNLCAPSHHSPRITTTFTANQCVSIETSKPFEMSDIQRYHHQRHQLAPRSRSPLVQQQQPNGSSSSLLPRLPPPPYYASPTRTTTTTTTGTDPRMEALLDFYKDSTTTTIDQSNRKSTAKTATIV